MSQRSSIKQSKTRGRSARDWAGSVRRAKKKAYTQIQRAPALRTIAYQGNQSAFANRQRVTLVYSDRLAGMTGGIGTGDKQVYRANSIFDPDFTGVGHQAMGHDEWAVMYHHYRVIRARISVQFSQNDGSTVPITCWVGLAATQIGTGDASTAIEQGRSAWKTIGTFGNDAAEPLVNIYDGRKFFGPSFIDADHKAAFTSNPAEDVFFHVSYQPTNAGDTGVGVTGMVVIEYDCELTEPKDLAAS